MTRPNDETLMAYADGVLTGDEQAAVAAYLETDDEARAFVEAMMASAPLLRQAFEAPMSEPVPAHLVATIMGGGKSESTGQGEQASVSNVVPFRRRLTQSRPGFALAASLLICIGVGLGYLLETAGNGSQPGSQLAIGPVPANNELARLLETAASGSAHPLESQNGSALMVLATFRDRYERPCREVEIFSGAGEMTPELAAVACRSSNGRWTVEGAVQIAIRSDDQTNFVPSSSAEQDALEGLLGVLGAKETLAPEDEEALIKRGWSN